MNKISLLLFSVFIIACNSDSPESQEKKLVYNLDLIEWQSTELGFQISYPSEWDTTLKNKKLVFMATERLQDVGDGFNESMNISAFSNRGEKLIELGDGNLEVAKSYYKNAVIESTIQKNKQGHDYYQIRILQSHKETKLETFVCFFMNEFTVYTITQTYEYAHVKKYQPIVAKIIDSFVLLGKEK